MKEVDISGPQVCASPVIGGGGSARAVVLCTVLPAPTQANLVGPIDDHEQSVHKRHVDLVVAYMLGLYLVHVAILGEEEPRVDVVDQPSLPILR
jgi:hypothetical protein